MRRQPHPLVALLQAERRRRGLSMDDVTALCGLPKNTISAWETGRRTPTLAALDTYAQVFGRAVTLTPPPIQEVHGG